MFGFLIVECFNVFMVGCLFVLIFVLMIFMFVEDVINNVLCVFKEVLFVFGVSKF